MKIGVKVDDLVGRCVLPKKDRSELGLWSSQAVRWRRILGAIIMGLLGVQNLFCLCFHPGALEEILVHSTMQPDNVLEGESPKVLRAHEAPINQFVRLLQNSTHVFYIEMTDVGTKHRVQGCAMRVHPAIERGRG